MARIVPVLILLALGVQAQIDAAKKVESYASVRLTSDLNSLEPGERQMIPHLIAAAKQMEKVFWKQAWGSREELMDSIRDKSMRKLLEINYGPWDRLGDNAPLLPDIGIKPAGARFYPGDMTREELETTVKNRPSYGKRLTDLYTLVRRTENGDLRAIPYNMAYRNEHLEAAHHLLAAAELAPQEDLRRYLELRADALVSNYYRASDMAWMDMTSNRLDIVIGPIETYEDQLFGYKAAHEAYVLIKDTAWSKRLERYAGLLPSLQKSLPVPEKYKAETPGSNAQLNAYDVVYYAGDCNAGAKTIAINLPNDEIVQLQKGTRRLQLKNAMKAKFERIMVPITDMLLAEDQKKHVTFDAFFSNTMFHEVAHGLGIKNTINGRGTVRTALKELASALEEGKADILGLHMITSLHRSGELKDDLENNYVTFLAGIFRSVRFGASSAHGRANMLRFNFFRKEGAFSRDVKTGRYRVHFDRMEAAMTKLSALILTLQGNGDYEGVSKLMAESAVIGETIRTDLARLDSAGIPVDIVVEQGLSVLGY